MDGIRFVADARFHFALSEVTIDVVDQWGREALIAYHTGLGGSC